MKKIKALLARWKVKHWDDEWRVLDEPLPWLQVDRPPLRAFWEKHKKSFFKVVPWLAGLIGGAAILKVIGLA